MTITIPPSDLAWIEAQVVAGRFASTDDAIAAAVQALKAGEIIPELSWAKPLVDESKASIARGEGLSAEQAFTHWEGTLAKLRG